MSESAVEVVRLFGGRATHADVLRHTTNHRLTTAIASGDLVRAARGVYVLADLPEPEKVAAACRGVLSHESAAAAWELPLLLPPTAVHVTVPRGAHPPRIKNVLTHERALDPRQIDGYRTSPVQTVLDCCTSLSFREALAVADSAARLIPCFLDDFLPAAQAPGRGRRQRLQVALHISGLSAGPFESALRAGLVGARLTMFEPQVEIHTAGGVHRVDLADRSRRIAIEADSFTWHGGRAALDRDCRRYDELVRAGWRVLRFSWEQVLFQPEWVVEVVADVVGGRRRAA